MKVTVFGGQECSDRVGQMAEELGRLLAQAGHTVITGGYGGVMSAVSKGAREGGGQVVGIVLKSIGEPNMFVSDVWTRDDIPSRLAALINEGDAYIVLPGGIGTNLELLAVLHTQEFQERLSLGSPAKEIIFLRSSDEQVGPILTWLNIAAGSAVVARLLRWAAKPQEVMRYLKAE